MSCQQHTAQAQTSCAPARCCARPGCAAGRWRPPAWSCRPRQRERPLGRPHFAPTRPARYAPAAPANVGLAKLTTTCRHLKLCVYGLTSQEPVSARLEYLSALSTCMAAPTVDISWHYLHNAVSNQTYIALHHRRATLSRTALCNAITAGSQSKLYGRGSPTAWGSVGPPYRGSVGLRRALHPLLNLARVHAEQLLQQLRRLQARASADTSLPPGRGALGTAG